MTLYLHLGKAWQLHMEMAAGKDFPKDAAKKASEAFETYLRRYRDLGLPIKTEKYAEALGLSLVVREAW